MKPDHFRDITATSALYRPGPLEGGMVDDYVAVKHGRKKAEYKHPDLKEILEETHGVMVYQEQVMRILNRLGNIPLSNAYSCIKAISKKKEAMIATNHEAFIEGSTSNGLSKKDAQEIWSLILKFAGYGFNKSHSTAYALIAYQTAYLKAHYPVEFMAALLSGDIQGRNFTRKDSLVEHWEDCTRMGIHVVPPDVNSSGVEFTVAHGKIHFGLSAVKGCGGAAAEAIATNRTKDGPFRDLFDFCERVEASVCNRSSIETLIKAGAFDCLGVYRSQLAAVVDRAIQAGAAALADRRSGQKSLFGDVEEEAESIEVSLPDIPEQEERERLFAEKEVLGFYLTSHPLEEYAKQLRACTSHSTTGIAGLPDRAEVALGGMLSAIKLAHTKNSRQGSPTQYANFDLEDLDGSIRCILWPDDFAKIGHLVKVDAILIARGAIDRRGGDETNLIVNELIPLDQIDARYTKVIEVRVDWDHAKQAGILSQVREIVRAYPGNRELRLMLDLENGDRVTLRSHAVHVDLSDEMQQRLEDLLGPGSYRRVQSAPAPSAPVVAHSR